MRELDVTKEYSLKGLGDEWKNCSMSYRPFDYDSLKQIIHMKEEDQESVGILIEMLKERFIKGTVIVNGQPVAMEKDDIDMLPMEELNGLITDASGNLRQTSREK